MSSEGTELVDSASILYLSKPKVGVSLPDKDEEVPQMEESKSNQEHNQEANKKEKLVAEEETFSELQESVEPNVLEENKAETAHTPVQESDCSSIPDSERVEEAKPPLTHDGDKSGDSENIHVPKGSNDSMNLKATEEELKSDSQAAETVETTENAEGSTSAETVENADGNDTIKVSGTPIHNSDQINEVSNQSMSQSTISEKKQTAPSSIVAKSPKRRASWVDNIETVSIPPPRNISKGGIRVFCRVRPLNVAEQHQQQQYFPVSSSSPLPATTSESQVKPPEVVEFVSKQQLDLIKPSTLQALMYQRQRTPMSSSVGAKNDKSEVVPANVELQELNETLLATETEKHQDNNTNSYEADILETANSYTQFNFDHVFTPLSTQQQCFAEVHETVLSSLDGFNTCIFAYGQTGSGKTHTMYGTPHEPGLTPRVISALYDEIEKRAPQMEYTVSASLVEIYNEQLRDLFANLPGLAEPQTSIAATTNVVNRPNVQFTKFIKQNEGELEFETELEDPISPNSTSSASILGNKLRIRPSKRGMFIDNCLKATCATRSSLLTLVEEGSGMRALGSTLLNSQSTRSHVILQLLVDGVDTITQMRSFGKITLVDLAGSERVTAAGSKGQRLIEAAHINKSLSALGDVFLALSNRCETSHSSSAPSGAMQNQTQSNPSQIHVPYRNSKLTYFLQDSIGGNSRTIMFVAISPSFIHHAETLNSLMFAKRVKAIKLDAAVANVDTAQILRFRHQLDQLKRKLELQQQQSQKQIKSLEKALEEKEVTLTKVINERNARTQTTNAVIAQLTLDLEEMKRAAQKEKRDEAKSSKDKDRATKDKSRAEAAERNVRELTSQRDSILTRIVQLEADASKAERELQRRTDERDTLTAKVSLLQQQQQSLQQQINTAQAHNQQLQVQNYTLQQQLQAAQSQLHSNSGRPYSAKSSVLNPNHTNVTSALRQNNPPPPPATPVISKATASVAPSSISSLASRTNAKNRFTTPNRLHTNFDRDDNITPTPSAARTPREGMSSRGKAAPSSLSRVGTGHARARSEFTTSSVRPTSLSSRRTTENSVSPTNPAKTRELLREYQARRQSRLQSSASQKSLEAHKSSQQSTSSQSPVRDRHSTSISIAKLNEISNTQNEDINRRLHARKASQETLNAKAREEMYLAKLEKKHMRVSDPSSLHSEDDQSYDELSFRAIVVTPQRTVNSSIQRNRVDTNVGGPLKATSNSKVERNLFGEAVVNSSVVLPEGWNGGPPPYNPDLDMNNESNIEFVKAPSLIEESSTFLTIEENLRRPSIPPEDISLLQVQAEIIDAEVVRALSMVEDAPSELHEIGRDDNEESPQSSGSTNDSGPVMITQDTITCESSETQEVDVGRSLTPELSISLENDFGNGDSNQ